MQIHEGNFLDYLRKKEERALVYVIDVYAPLYKSIIAKHLSLLPDYREDCLSEVLMKIWDHIDRYDERKGSFRNWSSGIARYCSIRYLYKHRYRLQWISLEDAAHLPANQKADELWRLELEELLMNLPQKDREIFRLLYLESLSTEEVANRNNLSMNALYSRLSRARKKLRKWYEGGKNDEE